MVSKRILITGASGCIGHYIAEQLMQETDHELFLLVRNPAKFKLHPLRPGVTLLQGDLRQIEQFQDLLPTIHYAILVAAAWGGTEEAFEINVTRTLQLINFLDPEVCQRIFYFSTASILNRQASLLPEAKTIGTDYIRSKYLCFEQLAKLELAARITPLFPTLVFGGGEQHKPYSHLSQGLQGFLRWMGLIRFFNIDGSFHFIHGRDIAQIVLHLLHHPEDHGTQPLILGNPEMTVNQSIQELCAYLGQRIPWQLPLVPWLLPLVIKLFRIQMAPWDYFCLNNRHFGYDHPVNPSSFGLSPYCPTLADLLRLSGVPQRHLRHQ